MSGIHEIQIQSNVPVPQGGRRGAPTKYPFRKLQIGDSFFIPAHRTTNRVLNAAYGFAKNHNPDFKVTCRSVDGGVRCWRIA